MACGDKVILYPPLNSMDQDDKNAIYEYVNKSYSLIQRCLNPSVSISTKASCINESSAARLLDIFNNVANTVGNFASKYDKEPALDLQEHYLIVYRSQTKPFDLEEALRRFTSTVLEERWKDKFGGYKYIIKIPLEAPIIVVQGTQLDVKRTQIYGQKEKMFMFTEVILPPGTFEIINQASQNSVGELKFIAKADIQKKNNMISFCTRAERRSESPTSCLSARITQILRGDVIVELSNSDEDSDFDDCPTSGGKVKKTIPTVPKIFYKGYHYNIRQKTKRQFFIRTKHEGDVPISIVRKWARKKTNA